ncbi:HAD-IA family hydrolase [Amycolatopsis rhabdoformis]|uniref:HAD-IA family hydrolase n=1 Tax=Amycolatopsis rhabdoformis TaxID=1448059 RepID=A0ABZ1IK83_9PSEU|nr:HAD-IA family hydrolase [Amycolatopsis rhabdoformis]WSE34173.1 HAD-IA family hydrolase [Amycolatopsis rhabdoformis]
MVVERSNSWSGAGRGRALRRAAAGRSRADTPTLRITTIVLDLGGVVVPTLFEVVDDPTFPKGPFGEDAAYAGVEQGRQQEREYWAELSRRRPDLDIGAFMRTRITVRQEMRTLLRDIGGRVRVAALTNDMAHWFGPEWPAKFPEFEGFDLLLEAARYGVLKPDPAVFRWALGQLGEQPGHCLFVDDLPANLTGARAVGMETEHFAVGDPTGSVRRILDRVGLPESGTAHRVYRPVRRNPHPRETR